MLRYRFCKYLWRNIKYADNVGATASCCFAACNSQVLWCKASRLRHRNISQRVSIQSVFPYSSRLRKRLSAWIRSARHGRSEAFCFTRRFQTRLSFSRAHICRPTNIKRKRCDAAPLDDLLVAHFTRLPSKFCQARQKSASSNGRNSRFTHSRR